MPTPKLPSVTTGQMRDLDRFMTHKTGIPILVMMEHAGLAIARTAQDMLGDKSKALIIAGLGHNGGDGLAAARHLHNWGCTPTIVLASGKSTRKGTKKQLYMLRQMKQSVIEYRPPDHAKLEQLIDQTDLVIDALIGYNLKGRLKPSAQRLVNSINQSEKPVLSVDGPSGLNFDTGRPQPVAVKATTTLTLALPKTGLVTPAARPYIGRLLAVYLSVPPSVYDKLGLNPPNLFKKQSVISLR